MRRLTGRKHPRRDSSKRIKRTDSSAGVQRCYSSHPSERSGSAMTRTCCTAALPKHAVLPGISAIRKTGTHALLLSSVRTCRPWRRSGCISDLIRTHHSAGRMPRRTRRWGSGAGPAIAARGVTASWSTSRDVVLGGLATILPRLYGCSGSSASTVIAGQYQGWGVECRRARTWEIRFERASF
jgi:hypothetical protein